MSYNIFNSPGFNSPGFNSPGFNSPGFNSPGYMKPGYMKPKFNITFMLCVVLVIVIGILVIWYVWAIQYRYSPERIENKLIAKYPEEIPETLTLSASKGYISADRKKASALMTVKTKDIRGEIKSQKTFTLAVDPNCSQINNSCIQL